MRQSRTTRRRLAAAVVEVVEPRRLLSGATFDTDTLAVTGSGGPDTITVEYTGGYAADGVTPAFEVSANVSGTVYTFTDVPMTAITVDAGDGDNSVSVSGSESDGPAGSVQPQPDLEVSVTTGAGNDSVAVLLNPGHNGPFTNCVSDVDVDLGDGNDTLQIDIDGELDAVCGGGNNTVYTIVKADENTEATVVGGDGNDELDETGKSPFMTFLANGGDDTLNAVDFYRNQFFPGTGNDTYSVASAGPQDALSVTLSDDLENFNCTWPADVTVYGNAMGNHLSVDSTAAGGMVKVYGQGGNDTIVGTAGDGGSHFYSGGTGTDVVDYSDATSGVAVYLDGSRAGGTDPAHPTDTFDGTVDVVWGSAHADDIVGTKYNNTLFGNGGNDTLVGNGGTDALFGGDDNDVLDATGGSNDFLDGGSGTDTGYLGSGDTTVGVESIISPIPGTTGGTAGSYRGLGNTVVKASDGNLSTYFDAPAGNSAVVTDDFGSAYSVSSIRYAPRASWAGRMVGGVFQGSNSADFSSATTLYTITTAPTAGVYTTVTAASAGPFRYVRYLAPAGSFGNVAEIVYLGAKSSTTFTKFSGTVIGTVGSYRNGGNTIAKAFDGSTSTFFDGPDATGDWVGLDLGGSKVVTQAKFAPRVGYESRMKGGVIQASNSATFTTGVVSLATIGSNPVAGSLTTLKFANATAYRYYRYLGPAGASCNLAELEFDG